MKDTVVAMKPYVLSLLFVVSVLMAQRPALGQPAPLDKNLDQALFDAVSYGKTLEVAAFLKKGANPNAGEESFTTVLSWALEIAADVEVVRLLLSYGAKVGPFDLERVLRNDDPKAQRVDIAKLLIEKGVDLRAEGDLELKNAAEFGLVEIVRLLLDKGVPANGKREGYDTPLMYAARGPYFGDLSGARRDKVERELDQVETVRILLDAGADVKAVNVNGETALMNAVSLGLYQVDRRIISSHVRVIQLLLTRGANLHATDTWGNTALHRAIEQCQWQVDRAEIVQTLLENGADLNARLINGDTELILTVEQSYSPFATVKFLLDRGAAVNLRGKDGLTPLMIASRMGRSELIGILIEKGAEVDAKDANGDTALVYAAEAGDSKTVKLLLEKGADPKEIQYLSSASYPLIEAATRDSTEDVRKLLNGGADAKFRGRHGTTPILLSAGIAYPDRDDMLKLLLEKGADPNGKDYTGFTPLMAAAHYNNPGAVRFLLDHHAEVNLKDNRQMSALLFAAKGGHKLVATILLARGADVGCRDEDGKTALMLAADSPSAQTGMVELLLAKGVDPKATDKEGNTALILAAKVTAFNVIEALVAHGAQVNAKNNKGRSALSYLLKESKDTWPEGCAYAVALLKRAGARD